MMSSESPSRWAWSIEVKWRSNVTEVSIQHFLDGLESPVWPYWDQCLDDADRNHEIPMLWLRGRNGRQDGRGRVRRMAWRIVTIHEGSMRMWLQDDFLRIHPSVFLAAV